MAKESAYSLSGSLVGMSMDYREYDDDAKILDSEKSTLSEILGGEVKLVYTKVLESDNYAQLGIKFMYLSGETEYVGSLIGSGLGYGSYIGKTKNQILDTDIDYMFTLAYNHGFELSYGVGIGYRSWRRELSPTQVEVYSWYSVRPKLGVAYNISDFYLGALIEYQYGIDTQMSINNSDVVVTLGSANITRLTIPLKYKINKQWEIFAEYVIDLQTIEKSDIAYFSDGTSVYGIWEPDSTAVNQYAKFGATFKF